jgi:hypothetical protein
LLNGVLRLAAASGDGTATELLGFGISHIELARTLAGIDKRNANERSLTVGDFFSRDV